MHSVALHWKVVRFIGSIEHMVQYIALELCYVDMVYSQRYEAESISKNIGSKADLGADVLCRSRLATVQIISNITFQTALQIPF